jgi:hypothetical protein
MLAALSVTFSTAWIPPLKKRSKNNKKQVKTKKIASEIRFGLLKKMVNLKSTT